MFRILWEISLCPSGLAPRFFTRIPCSLSWSGCSPGALPDDFHWSERVLSIPDFTSSFQDRDFTENLPTLFWIEGIKKGTLPIRDVAHRVTTNPSAPLTGLYSRVERFRKYRVYVSYEDGHGAFIRAREGQDGQGGQPAEKTWGTSHPVQMRGEGRYLFASIWDVYIDSALESPSIIP